MGCTPKQSPLPHPIQVLPTHHSLTVVWASVSPTKRSEKLLELCGISQGDKLSLGWYCSRFLRLVSWEILISLEASASVVW